MKKREFKSESKRLLDLMINSIYTNKDIDIIGQFGVGFYSAFMVADEITVISKSYDSEDAYRWNSKGLEGYTLEKCDKSSVGTDIILHIKDNTDDDNYDDYLTEFKLKDLIKKYSDYIRYPIKMEVSHSHKKDDSDEYETVKEIETINSMIPIWKKNKKDVSDEEYEHYYTDTYYDYEKPLKVISTSVEGAVSYKGLLFVPSHAPYDFYTKEYEKGLSLYSNGVLIMDKCSDLLPDYFSFVKGVIDTEDIPLNISRETLQDNKNIKLIAKSIESKIKKELLSMLSDERDKYEEFYKAFGMGLKFGIYNDYGINKDKLSDLVMFYSSNDKKLTTLKEYTERMKEGQESIYYACGESVDKIDMMPQVESVKDKYEVLYLTEYVDEFTIITLAEYNSKKFVNVSSENTDISTEEEKKHINEINDNNKDMLSSMKDLLGDSVKEVKFTSKLKNHPVCLTTEGEVSTSMEKVINSMPTGEKIKASEVLEINSNHKIADKLKELYKDNKEEFEKYTKVIYFEARLIEGLPIDNPTEMSNLMCDIMADK